MKLRYCAVIIPIIVLFVVYSTSTNRIVVINNSGSRLDHLTIILTENGGDGGLKRIIQDVDSGRKISVQHEMNDFTLHVFHSIGEQEVAHMEQFVDLWRGEGWVVEVLPDGKFESFYESTYEYGQSGDVK